MKKSNKWLFSGLGAVVLLFVVFLIHSRMLLVDRDGAELFEKDRGEQVDWDHQEDLDFRDFSEIEIRGKISLEIRAESDFSIMAREKKNPGLNITQLGDRLILETDKHGKGSAHLDIGMPYLALISSEGAVSAELYGFRQSGLIIDMQGAYSLNAHEMQLDTLICRVEGVGSIDFYDAPSVNMDLSLEGVNSGNFLMNGGDLRLAADGIGSVNVGGTCLTKKIDKEGMIAVNVEG